MAALKFKCTSLKRDRNAVSDNDNLRGRLTGLVDLYLISQRLWKFLKVPLKLAFGKVEGRIPNLANVPNSRFFQE
jgi:hypothetical protein